MSGIVYKQIGVDGNAIVPVRYRGETRGSFRRDPRKLRLLRLPVRPTEEFPSIPSISHLGPLLEKREKEKEGEAIKSRSRTTPRLLSLNNSAGVVRESFAGFVARPRTVLSMLAEKASGA